MSVHMCVCVSKYPVSVRMSARCVCACVRACVCVSVADPEAG